MSPTAPAQVRFTLPRSQGSMFDFLERIGVDVHRNMDKKIQTVARHFTRLAAEGYDLSLANATAENEAFKALNSFHPVFSVDDYTLMVKSGHRPNGERHVITEALVKGKTAGKAFHEVAESVGFLDALNLANAKVLKKFYGVDDPVQIAKGGYHVDLLSDEGSTTGRTRVTIVFNNGYATQAVHENQVDASYTALNEGLDFDLRLRRAALRPTGTQPR